MSTILRHFVPVGALAVFVTLMSASCETSTPNPSGAGANMASSSNSSGNGGDAGTAGAGAAGTSTSSSSSGSSGIGGGGQAGAGGNGAGGNGVGGNGTGGSGIGGAGGSGGCLNKQARCEYKTDTELDKQSFRQIAGYNCLTQASGWQFVPVATCDYSEVCDSSMGMESSCVSCGPKGLRFGYREVDGVVTDNCKGCGSGCGWSVYGCYAETASFGSPWVDVVWQSGFDVIRFALLGTGEVKLLGAVNKQVSFQSVQINAFEIQPNGLVDFDVTANVLATDNFQQQHVWNMQARVVGICK